MVGKVEMKIDRYEGKGGRGKEEKENKGRRESGKREM